MKQLNIRGTARPALIEEAIRRIQADPATAMSYEYLGIKNYAGFGDQREDHNYGMGPKHGTIVFEIGRTDAARKQLLGSDAVYLLEAYRDFGTVNVINPNSGAPSYERVIGLSLCGAIRRLDELTANLKELTNAISERSVESHVAEVIHG